MQEERQWQAPQLLKVSMRLPRNRTRLGFGETLFIGCLLAALAVGFAIVSEVNARLFMSGLIGGVICWIVFRDLQSRGATGSYCLNYVLVGGIIGKFIFILVGVAGVATLGGAYGFNLFAKPWIMLVFSNMALLVAWFVGRQIFRCRVTARHSPNWSQQIEVDRRCLDILLIVMLPVGFGQTAAHFLPSFLGFGFQVFGAGLDFLPFFAGRFLSNRKGGFWIWIVALLANASIMLMIGGRFRALFPVVIFGIGWICSLPRRARLPVSLLAAGLSLPGFFVLGSLGVIRDELGRDRVENISGGHFDRMMNVASQLSSPAMRREIFSAGLARMVAWANYAPAMLSPEVIPYRGFKDFGQEVITAAAIYSIAPQARSRMADLKMGTMAANDYGFMVNEYTSVEWGVIADGWSRAGWWSATLFLAVAYTFIFTVERWLLSARVFRPAIKVIMVAILMGLLTRAGSVPLLEFMRTSVLYIILYCGSLWVLEHVLGVALPQRPSGRRLDVPSDLRENLGHEGRFARGRGGRGTAAR